MNMLGTIHEHTFSYLVCNGEETTRNGGLFLYLRTKPPKIVKRWSKEGRTASARLGCGGSMILRDFYNSKEWKQTRAAFIRARGGLCERCLKRGLLVAGTTVHHKTELTPENAEDPAVSLNWDNLELLCRDCHEAHHSRDKRRWRVDEAGRIAVIGD